MYKVYAWIVIAIFVFGIAFSAIYLSTSNQVKIFNKKYDTNYSVEEFIFAKDSIESIVNRVEPKVVNIWIEQEE